MLLYFVYGNLQATKTMGGGGKMKKFGGFTDKKEFWKTGAILAAVLIVMLVFLSVDYIWAAPVATEAEGIQTTITEVEASGTDGKHEGAPKAPRTADTSNVPLWGTATFLLLTMLLFLTLLGRNFGLFPYPTAEHKDGVVRRICGVGNRHRKLRGLMVFAVVSYVFLLNIYKHLFFSNAARKTYAKA